MEQNKIPLTNNENKKNTSFIFKGSRILNCKLNCQRKWPNLQEISNWYMEGEGFIHEARLHLHTQ